MRVSAESGALVRMLDDRYGLRVAAAAVRKDVPDELHRVTDDLKVAYLQGLFSADATIRTAAGGARAGGDPGLDRARARPARSSCSCPTWASPAGSPGPGRGVAGCCDQAPYLQRGRPQVHALVGSPLSAEKQAKVEAILAHPFARGLYNPRATTVESIVPTASRPSTT